MAVIADITVSLDGYVTGPNPGPSNGLGDGGEALHAWVFASDSPQDRDVLERSMARYGAVVMGRRLFDVVDGPSGWSEDRGFGAGAEPDGAPPVFVVTHTQPEHVRLADQMHIVTEGVAVAVARAVDAAGDKDVSVMGGGSVIRSVLAEGLADRLVLHVAPLLLGSGTPLFTADEPLRASLHIDDVVATMHATHMTYLVGAVH
ncbi:MAG: bifunctional deaminase-reductase domain protein [Thermoleophilia bacterium]|nr:bifunctional deaminase-reductase domain protein [Thermoleophilia bacterium]